MARLDQSQYQNILPSAINLAMVVLHCCVSVGLSMPFEFSEDLENDDYVEDKVRGIKLWKSGGGSGFRSYRLDINSSPYWVHIEETIVGNNDEHWTIEYIRHQDNIQNQAIPSDIFFIAQEAITALKDFQWGDMKDTISVQLPEKLLTLRQYDE